MAKNAKLIDEIKEALELEGSFEFYPERTVGPNTFTGVDKNHNVPITDYLDESHSRCNQRSFTVYGYGPLFEDNDFVSCSNFKQVLRLLGLEEPTDE